VVRGEGGARIFYTDAKATVLVDGSIIDARTGRNLTEERLREVAQRSAELGIKDEQARLTYTNSEVAAVYTIADMTGSPDSGNIASSQVIHTDHPYQTVFSRTGSYPAAAANLSADNRDGPTDHPITVYRRYQSTGTPKFVLVKQVMVDGNQTTASVPVRRQVPQQQICRPDQSILYNNGDVMLCANRTI